MMSGGAIAMLIVGCVVFYGGLAWCIYRALRGRSRRLKENEDRW
ncbi:MAG: MetS family NSS transporter small subunit [Thermoplasmatota archaeon]